jgi:hypothetical protein
MILRAARRVEFALANPEVPGERQALTLLERAYALGVADSATGWCLLRAHRSASRWRFTPLAEARSARIS